MEHDSPWKDVLEDLFEEFLSFFFPHIHKDIDFALGYEFLDKELQKIIPSSDTGKRIVDKLIKVYLRDGSEKWLLIHIEIQGYEQEEFPERMYVYNYRIFDKFRKEVISLALLTDDNPSFRPNEYRRERWGFEVTCRYPLIKIIDYREHLEELEASSHPFAIIVRAYLRTLETEGNVQERYTWKKRFLLELYQRGMKRETILAIYKFIDWVMTLPGEMETEILETIKNIEEAAAMPHITTAERIGLEKGQKIALQKAIATVISAKFGEAGPRLIERIHQVERLEALEKVLEKLMRAPSLSEAEKIFEEIESNGVDS